VQIAPTTTPSAVPAAGLRVSDAVRSALDLSSGGRTLLEDAASLTPEERGEFLRLLAGLLSRGVVGTETVIVEGAARETFVSTRPASWDLAHGTPAPPGSRLDRRA